MRHLPSMSSLRALDAAARHRSFSGAGEELGLTHGAISHRVRGLEKQLGERLFVRRGNTMEPTPAASRYLGSVRQALELLCAAFDTAADRTICTLRIAVLPSFASHWLVARLPDFGTIHPSISIVLDARLDVVPLGQGHADAAIRHGNGAWPRTRARPLVRETAFPVCSPAYRDRMEIETPADLSRCTLLRHAGVPWTAWFAAAGLDLTEPRDGAAFADAGLLIDTALAGHGVLLGRDILVADAIASGRLVRLFNCSIPVDGGYWFVRPQSDGRCGAEITMFGDWVEATLVAAFHGSSMASAEPIARPGRRS